MRPLQLSFSGIRSYPGDVGPLDFTGKTLIAILGDTGAGKSTILEAITLALYGNCTWTDREHKALMADGAAQMTVDLTFAHDGQCWRARRVFHANTIPSSHLLQNLDTGEEIDNKRAVNKKITTLLQLPFDSFITAVLLPQGKFDRLLTATGRDRTDLLKGIFGVQAIEAMRDQASLHRDQLTELINQAKLARGRLLDDPAAAGQAAGHKAEQAERLAGQLRQALGTVRSLRVEASAAREQHARFAAAADTLDRHEKRDVDSELARVGKAAGELAALDTAAGRAKQEFGTLRGDTEAQLAAAEEDGLTLESLARVAALLDGLPGRIAELAADQAQLAKDAEGIAKQARELQAAETRLNELRTTAGVLAQTRRTADSALEEYRQGFGQLQDDTSTALRHAANTGKALRERESALGRMGDLQKAVGPLEAATGQAARQLQSAEQQLASIHSHEAAHVAGTGLSPGDPCLICRRSLPDDYQPPEPTDPDAMRTGDQAVNDARDAAREAESKLAEARADAANAQREFGNRQATARRAQAHLGQACQAAAAAMGNLAQRKWDDETRLPGEREFAATLQAACTQLSEASEDDQENLLGTAARQLLGPAHAVEKALASAVARAEDAAREGKADAARAADKLSLEQKTHDEAVARLVAARERHAAAHAKLGQELATLPALARGLIPRSTPDIASGDIDTAKLVIAERREQLDAWTRDRERAVTELEKLTATQLKLSQRRSREITGPLQALAAYLDRQREAIEQAASVLPQDRPGEGMVVRPADITAETVGAYATALTSAEADVRESLSGAAAAAGEKAHTRLMELDAAAAKLRSGRQEIPAIALAEGEQLLDPGALDPVVAAEANARMAAQQHRADQEAAEGQVQEAASLDAAIKAGCARLSAVDALRGLFADAKFHQYLTDRRTRALLGVASDIFGRLSGGEFGFAPDFQITSRRSGAVRSAKTLSGGETFLASLALALALVELHSRSGARLGALFLDEGFGSLDIDALAGSLTVLQAETGGDKLVAIISHLHAVAEAVEDVMWVERQPDGSSIRWLTSGERDALAREEVTGGLLNLI